MGFSTEAPPASVDRRTGEVLEQINAIMDRGSLFGTILGTILNYKRDPNVHC